MKRTAAIITMSILTIALALPALAAQQKAGMGMAGRMMANQANRINANLTDEQREQLEKVRKAFIDNTTDLRNNLRTKHTELTNLLSSPDPDVNKAKALQKEISDLQANLAQKRLELRIEVLKINPDARYRQGLGRRKMMGLGSGMDIGQQ